MKESGNSPTKEENIFPVISSTSNDGGFNTKANSDSNNRMSNSGQTANNNNNNNNRTSTRRDMKDDSTGEITQF